MTRVTAIIAAVLGIAVISGVAVGTAVAAGPGTVPTNNYDEQIAEANAKKAEQERELEQLEADLRHMDQEIAKAVRQLRELEEQLPGLQRELELAQERLDSAIVEQQIVADKLVAAEAQDVAITDQIALDNERIDELRLLIAELARETHRGNGTKGAIDVVLGSTSAEEFIDQYALQHSVARAQSHALDELEDIAATNRNRGARQEAVREYIEELKVRADELVEETEYAREVAQDKKDAVDAKLQEVREVKAYLESKRVEAEQRQRDLEAEQERIEDELLELIRKKMEAQQATNPTPIGTGHLAFPTAVPYITSSYGSRVHPIFGYTIHHNGTDFRAWCGTPIYAAAGGRVDWAQWRGGFGNHVMIDHGVVNGNVLHSSYAHLSSYAVSAGQYVTQGQVVGYSGSTGNSVSCHLHFEVYVNGNHVNPMNLLGPIP